MTKPRVCPHCSVEIPIYRGYTFDEKFNLICGNCGKISYLAASLTSPLNKGRNSNQYPILGPILAENHKDNS